MRASALGSCTGLCVKVGRGHATVMRTRAWSSAHYQSTNTMLACIIDANTEEALSMPSCRSQGSS